MVDCPIQQISWTPLSRVKIFSPSSNSSIGFNASEDSVIPVPLTNERHVISAKRSYAFSRSIPTNVYSIPSTIGEKGMT